MEKRIKAYLNYLSELADNAPASASEDSFLREKILTQIKFFQHERLIHLLVTLFFAIATVGLIVICLFTLDLSIAILSGMFLILLIPYIRHYFILENSVQKMYIYYDSLFDKWR
ncbi:MAG: hypothetical protein KBS85_04395 [Lachnospiraceae bacterium]|nr:hypothetical protein [Candidatus Merdinaster equi]